MTNEPPESPARVMDGPGRRGEGGVPRQDKCFPLPEPGRGGTEHWGDVSVKALGRALGGEGETGRQEDGKRRGERHRG